MELLARRDMERRDCPVAFRVRSGKLSPSAGSGGWIPRAASDSPLLSGTATSDRSLSDSNRPVRRWVASTLIRTPCGGAA